MPLDVRPLRTRSRRRADRTRERSPCATRPSSDAETAGYKNVTPYVPLIGAHYMRFLTVDGTFDIEQPEMLLYDGTQPDLDDGRAQLLRARRRQPEGSPGRTTTGTATSGCASTPTTPLVLGDEQTTRGGVPQARRA